MDKLYELVEKHWIERTGLLALIGISWGVEFNILEAFEIDKIYYSIPFILTPVLCYFPWHINRRYSKTPPGKLGIVVSISCLNSEDYSRVREDFTLTLRQLIKSGRLSEDFFFIEIPQYHAQNIVETEDAKKVLDACNAKFMLWGRVRVRNNQNILDMNGIVSHYPISGELAKNFQNEFNELLLQRVIIPNESDFLGFQFASECTDIVCKYIIGITMAFSGYLDSAEMLFRDVLEKVSLQNQTTPVFLILKERIPIRLAEINHAHAELAHSAWVGAHNPAQVQRLGNYLNHIESTNKSYNINYLNLRSIYEFLDSKDIEKAIKYLKKIKIKDRNNAWWHFNIAFLYAYIGDMDRCIYEYDCGAKFDTNATLIFQIEDFIAWLLSTEPDKYQLHFCLGYFNWKIKGDRS